MGTLENGWVHFGCSREKNKANARMAGKKERKKKKKREMSQPALSNKSFNPFKV
ncbi:hypothetical protein SLEP1_g40042 [Rubroshorea leprosula]|uniref:Uncharacterized protein n=1 Tax=Rubroshorea leprosula TaxID=152421 RepID=A0AAV5L328_9ROSI|nr:hypothetical protein SLEP1_g40042 [Rubroshorea leprosula]